MAIRHGVPEIAKLMTGKAMHAAEMPAAAMELTQKERRAHSNSAHNLFVAIRENKNASSIVKGFIREFIKNRGNLNTERQLGVTPLIAAINLTGKFTANALERLNSEKI